MTPRFRAFVFQFGEVDWDPAESDRCFATRGFDFGHARAIFDGPILRRRAASTDDMRFQALGKVGNVTLLVVYAVRNGQCRILAARRATIQETWFYYER